MPKVKSFDPQRDILKKSIKHSLVEKEWSQEHLGHICGYDKSRISRIVNYPDRQSFKTLSVVFKKLGIKEIPLV